MTLVGPEPGEQKNASKKLGANQHPFVNHCISSWNKLIGEFDPGSGRTLAACLTHASRTELSFKLAF